MRCAVVRGAGGALSIYSTPMLSAEATRFAAMEWTIYMIIFACFFDYLCERISHSVRSRPLGSASHPRGPELLCAG